MAYKKETVKIDKEKITFKKGALSSQLKLGKGEKFNKSELNNLKKIENGKEFTFRGNKFKMTPLMKKRITFALTLMK